MRGRHRTPLTGADETGLRAVVRGHAHESVGKCGQTALRGET